MKRGRPARFRSTRLRGRSRPGRATALVIVVLVAAVAALLLWWRAVARAPRPAAPSPAAAPDSLARLDPFAAYQKALASSEASRFVESLPYFRHALATPPNAWEPYSAYAGALFQTTHQGRRRRLGRLEPVTRSSWERIEMMYQVQAQIDVAEGLAHEPKPSGYVIASRAQILAVWGLSWNALTEFIRAAELSSDQKLRAQAMVQRMRHPLPRPGEGGEP